MRDFFAPECYAPFEGDNGGATAQGVTADSIKVVYYLGPDDDPIINYITAAIANDDTNADSEADADDDARLLRDSSTSSTAARSTCSSSRAAASPSDEVAARADAVRIAEEIKPFAVLGGPALTAAFGDELSSRGMLCISCNPSQPRTGTRHAIRTTSASPPPAADERARRRVHRQAARREERRVRRRRSSRLTPRKYGLVYIESSAESAAIADEFVANSSEHGHRDRGDVSRTHSIRRRSRQTAAQIIAKLKASGVTTVIFSGDPVAPRDFTRRPPRRSTSPSGSSAIRAGRHHRVRPHVRPGTVEARLRRVTSWLRGPCPR